MRRHNIYKYIGATCMLWILSVAMGHAQTVVIKGKVVDDQKSALELAQVRVEITIYGKEYRYL